MLKLRSLFLSIIVFIAVFGSVSQASELQTVTFQVDNMTCSICPYTVKKVDAKYEGHGEGWAKVTFDPQKTNVGALIKATTHAGYPAHQKQEPL